MKITRATRIADIVLPHVLRAVRKTPELSGKNTEVFVDLYLNGRERGYAIKVFSPGVTLASPRVTFSENRNSDDVVVYPQNAWLVGRDAPADRIDGTHGITEHAYTKRRYFSSVESNDLTGPRAAASFIVEDLVDQLRQLKGGN